MLSVCISFHLLLCFHIEDNVSFNWREQVPSKSHVVLISRDCVYLNMS